MNEEVYKAFMADPVNARLVLSASLENFIKFFHWYLYRDEFIVMGFHREIIRKIEDIAFGRNKKKNLAINISPRVGKSSIVKYACAWSYMINPKSNNLYTSYSDDLANDFSKDIREIVESEPFVRFTGLSFKKGKTGADYWVTSAGGGFRAAPLGGGLTGYGFGISGEGFGGFGICFPHDEKVWTNKGKIRIGDIVEKKISVKVLSRDLVGEKDEYKEIEGWKKNPASDIYKVVMNNGCSVECTPDHKFWTVNRGYVSAVELNNDDIVLSSADSLNLAYGKTKFIGHLLATVVFIKDKIKILFGKANSLFWGVVHFLCKPLERFSAFNVNNGCLRNAVRFGNLRDFSLICGNIDNVRSGELASGENKRSVFNSILHILRFGSISKIGKRVVLGVPVKMSDFNTFGLLSDKSSHHSLVGVNSYPFSVFATTSKQIPISILTKFKDSLLNSLKRFASFVVNHSRFASDSTQRTNTVIPLKMRYCSPLFIYKLGHIDNSYCLTIRDNHNMYVGKSQGFLVKNCDDPNKPSLVKSQTELQNTIDLYVNAFKSRANNRAKSPIIMIMQRVAIDDLTGYVLENEAEDWDLIKVPALNEETGESIWEDKLPAEELWKMKKQSPFVYYSQYQQEPIVIGGSVIKTEWFRFYPVSENYDYQYTFVTSDTAMKKGEGNDFTVFSFWGKTFDNKLHLIDLIRGKWDAGELKQQVILTWEKWKGFKCPPYGMYIEDKSSGIGVLQELRQKFPIPLIPVTRARYKNDNGVVIKADKLSRAMTCVPYIANGWVYLPNNEKDDISSLLLSECAAFNMELSQKHDDMVDTMLDAIDIAFGTNGVSSIFI